MMDDVDAMCASACFRKGQARNNSTYGKVASSGKVREMAGNNNKTNEKR
jgi:hypothetical protein